jgi:4-aminobutyrate aminotransferase-like enzyme
MATKTATLVSPTTTPSSYAHYVNPQWLALLNLLDTNVEYARCEGCELFTKDGRRILDYLSGILRTQRGSQSSVHRYSNKGRTRQAAPPLVVSKSQLDQFVPAIHEVVEVADSSPSFWTEALDGLDAP